MCTKIVDDFLHIREEFALEADSFFWYYNNSFKNSYDSVYSVVYRSNGIDFGKISTKERNNN